MNTITFMAYFLVKLLINSNGIFKKYLIKFLRYYYYLQNQYLLHDLLLLILFLLKLLFHFIRNPHHHFHLHLYLNLHFQTIYFMFKKDHLIIFLLLISNFFSFIRELIFELYYLLQRLLILIQISNKLLIFYAPLL